MLRPTLNDDQNKCLFLTSVGPPNGGEFTSFRPFTTTVVLTPTIVCNALFRPILSRLACGRILEESTHRVHSKSSGNRYQEK